MRRRLTESEVVDVDGFEVQELIGSGGYSRVYRALQHGFDRTVALKVLHVGVESAAQRRAFENECRAMGSLSEHPNIVTVLMSTFSVGAPGAEPKPCIVMEYYGGGTLGDVVKEAGPLGLDRLLSIGVQISGALATAHRRGVLHRDIKPHNIFLSEYGQPALGDFGISSFEGERTVTGTGGGLTLHYAPPEVLEGAEVTARSDVYSLAATMYLLATGERPFPRGSDQTMTDVARRILLEPPPRLGPSFPASLADLLETAMAKQPSDRPESAVAFGRKLQSIEAASGLQLTALPIAGLAARPEFLVSAVDPGAVDPGAVDLGAVDLGRVRRRRSFATAGGAVCLLVLGGATAAWRAGDSGETGSTGFAPGVLSAGADDPYFAVPGRPTGVSVSIGPREGGGEQSVIVTWSPSADAVTYQVDRIDGRPAEGPGLDSDGSTSVVVEVDEPTATFEVGTGERPCVTVTAVGPGGHQSQPSTSACAEEN